MLEQLSNAFGTSGYEKEVRGLIQAAVEKRVDLSRVDSLGNLIVRVPGRAGFHGPRLLLSAHMDEVGFAVSEITAGGDLKLHKIGGIDDRVLPSKRVIVRHGDGELPGVIGMKSPHLHKDKEEFEQVLSHDKLFVDIGCAKKEEAEKLVAVGDGAYFATRYFEQGGRAFGKCFDDRAGCAIIAEIIQGSPKLTGGTPFYAAFTVQEEVGVRGARVLGTAVKPDVYIAVEGTAAGEGPPSWLGRDDTPSTELGKGPALSFLDLSHIADPAWFEFVRHIAETEKIPYQYKR
ncbi:MAG TPA: M42 family peptidase, partial [Candidatus Coatesbacteria bacterium]|nr:M42 family peptidase [Candidatus Coatesbacteria bacterium]